MEPDVLRLPDALELTRYCVVWLRLASKTVSWLLPCDPSMGQPLFVVGARCDPVRIYTIMGSKGMNRLPGSVSWDRVDGGGIRGSSAAPTEIGRQGLAFREGLLQ